MSTGAFGEPLPPAPAYDVPSVFTWQSLSEDLSQKSLIYNKVRRVD